MTERWKTLALENPLSLSVVGILVLLLSIYIVVWHGMEVSIEELQQEVARLDQTSQGLIPKIITLNSIERDIFELRNNLSSRLKQFPKNMDLKNFRRDVVEIANQRNVTVRMWKPEIPLIGLLHSETDIPITVRVEGNFHDTVQFLDEMRQLSWVQTIASLFMSRKQGGEDSPLIITNFDIHGLTPLGMEHVQRLL